MVSWGSTVNHLKTLIYLLCIAVFNKSGYLFRVNFVTEKKTTYMSKICSEFQRGLKRIHWNKGKSCHLAILSVIISRILLILSLL